jgi:hypothetical protein
LWGADDKRIKIYPLPLILILANYVILGKSINFSLEDADLNDYPLLLDSTEPTLKNETKRTYIEQLCLTTSCIYHSSVCIPCYIIDN